MPASRPQIPADVLLVAALRSEWLPLVRRSRQRQWLTRHLLLGNIAGKRVALLRCGVGESRARDRTRDALLRCPATRVLSCGTCGALVDDLSVGDVVTASDLLGLDSAGPLPLPGARPVVMATVPRVVDRPKARASLSSRGAEVCEMEAAGVFEAAAGRPFHAIKVVSDLAGAKPPRLRGLPRPVRKPFFDLLTYRLMDRQLTPVIEAWLRSERT